MGKAFVQLTFFELGWYEASRLVFSIKASPEALLHLHCFLNKRPLDWRGIFYGESRNLNS